MKCVIFCCLLAFWAFKTVVASHYDDAFHDIDDFTTQRQNDIQDFCRCERKFPKFDTDCEQLFNDPIWNNHEKKIEQLDTCDGKDKACYDNIVRDATNEANRIYNATRNCITPLKTKCYKDH